MGLPYITDHKGRKTEMPYSTKERPRVRAAILSLLQKRGITLEELWAEMQSGGQCGVVYVGSLKKQCKLMIYQQRYPAR
jgi:hypothetical protein